MPHIRSNFFAVLQILKAKGSSEFRVCCCTFVYHLIVNQVGCSKLHQCFLVYKCKLQFTYLQKPLFQWITKEENRQDIWTIHQVEQKYDSDLKSPASLTLQSLTSSSSAIYWDLIISHRSALAPGIAGITHKLTYYPIIQDHQVSHLIVFYVI